MRVAIYREQAIRLQDPGVAEAARLSISEKNDVLAEMAAVWSKLEPSQWSRGDTLQFCNRARGLSERASIYVED